MTLEQFVITASVGAVLFVGGLLVGQATTDTNHCAGWRVVNAAHPDQIKVLAVGQDVYDTRRQIMVFADPETGEGRMATQVNGSTVEIDMLVPLTGGP